MRWSFLVGALVIAAVGIGGWIIFRDSAAPEVVGFDLPEAAAVPDSPPAATVAEPVPSEPRPVAVPQPPVVELPPLAESDSFVRRQLPADVSPVLAAWLLEDDLIRRAAVVLQNAERGDYPRRQLSFIKVRGPFKVISRDDKMYVDAAAYQRFDAVTEALTAIPPQRFVELFDLLAPLLSQAVGDLGVRDINVRTGLNAVIDMVLDTPIVDGPVEVVRPNVMYQFADERLEALQPLQKQLLRAGPDNLRRIQNYLREVARANA